MSEIRVYTETCLTCDHDVEIHALTNLFFSKGKQLTKAKECINCAECAK